MNTISSLSKQHEHLHTLLKEFHTAMLVTHALGDQLRARPMAIALVEPDCRLWFIAGTETTKTHEIEANANVQVICQRDHSVYLSLRGHAELIDNRGIIHRLWREPFRVWFPGGKDDPNITLIAVRPYEGEYWDNEGFNKIKYLFESAKAYVTGHPPEVADPELHAVVPM